MSDNFDAKAETSSLIAQGLLRNYGAGPNFFEREWLIEWALRMAYERGVRDGRKASPPNGVDSTKEEK